MTDTDGTPTEPLHVESVRDFEQKITENEITFVDFYADWCGPCKMLEPIVEDLAAETPASVLKVDIDEHRQLASRFQVRGVPTTVLFVDGQVEETMVGVRGKGEYASRIERVAN